MEQPSNNPLNILVVEDNPEDQFFVTELLELSTLKIGSVFAAETNKDALSFLKAHSIDIILLDLSLPDSSGISTFASIHRQASSIPIIILSGMNDTGLALEAITLGSQDYLIKGEFDEKLLGKTILYSIERIHTLNALRESIERFNLVSQATNDMVWDWNLVTGEFYRNKEGWRKIFGSSDTTDQSNVSESWTKFVHPDDKTMVWDYINKIYQSTDQNIFELENRALREDGTVAYVLNRGYLIRDESGKPVRLTGATQDITEKKLSEQVLKASEERYRYLFNNNPACILIWDPENLKIIEVNKAASLEYGYSQEEFVNLNILDISLPQDFALIRKFAQAAKTNHQLGETRISHSIDKAGETIYMDISSHVILYSGVPLVLVLATNVTSRVLLEKALEDERQKKQQEITDAVISGQESERLEIGRELHDNINQVLASSRLFLGLGKSGTNEYFLDRSEQLINTAITEIRRLSHELIPPSLHEPELKMALEQIFDNLSGTTNIKIHKDFTGFDDDAVSDKFKLTVYRIVQEQFHNIHKYADAENVWLALTKQGDKLRLTIKDDGRGIDSSKKPGGVGLMNIRTRASLFGGQTMLVSSPGNGCELAVTFDGKKVNRHESSDHRDTGHWMPQPMYIAARK